MNGPAGESAGAYDASFMHSDRSPAECVHKLVVANPQSAVAISLLCDECIAIG